MKLGAAALLTCLWSLACTSAPFRGGYARPEGRLTGTRTIQRFVPGACVDGRGRAYSARFTALDLLETRAGRPLLLEHRQGYDLLVVDNAHLDGAFLVFEVIIDGERLRRYRIPLAAGLGQLELGREFSVVSQGTGFRARLAAAHLTCPLVPSATTDEHRADELSPGALRAERR